MCELFVARSPEPFRIGELWPFAARLERYGIAGFGWGAAWRAADGTLALHRDPAAFRDDPGRDRLADVETTSLLVHLRRPSRLSTLALADTQPFLDPAGRFAVSHNGDFRHVKARRDGYRAAGRIHGRADSEVGARWLEDEWGHGEPPLLLAALHDAFGGQANLAVLAADGTPHVYAGNQENPVFRFRLPVAGGGGRPVGGTGSGAGGRSVEMVSTGLYSLDRSLFRLVAPHAQERRVLPYRATASLDA